MKEKIIYTSCANHKVSRLLTMVLSALYTEIGPHFKSLNGSQSLKMELLESISAISRDIETLFDTDKDTEWSEYDGVVKFAAAFDLEDKINSLIDKMKLNSLIPEDYAVKIIMDVPLTDIHMNHLKRLFSAIIKIEYSNN